MLRRALGLTQQELAFLLGYDSHSQIARLEDGTKSPTFIEGLMIELVLGSPVVDIFPRALESAQKRLIVRLRRLLGKSTGSSSNPRFPYKFAQLERIAASVESRAASQFGVHRNWETRKFLDWVESYL